MPLFCYNFFLAIYFLGIRLYGFFNQKAGKWVSGRVGWRERLSGAIRPGEQRIWIHCSSLGEFEQGRPVIEALRAWYPDHKIVLTFFSPSGYEARKDYREVDYVFYLPVDTERNARDFLEKVDPKLAIFVKYEFWYHYLDQLAIRKVPALLISAAFRKEQIFFKWYGGLFRQMLHNFTCLFVQDKQSATLLQEIGLRSNVVICGDTRYDRVATIAANVRNLPAIEQFKSDFHLLIAGSTWPGDETILKSVELPEKWKLIIAPHEIGTDHIRQITELFAGDTILFSALTNENSGSSKKVLIIDNIGMLASLYSYGEIAYVGGGFKKGGIHNTLEPAVFGLPIVMGPVYEKFVEARQLVTHGYAFPVENEQTCKQIIAKLVGDTQFRTSVNSKLREFMARNTGATETIMKNINQENWL